MAFRFSRPEDVSSNPVDGTQIVMASTGLGGVFPSDNWGTTYLIDIEFEDILKKPLNQIDGIPAVIKILYDSDDAGAGQSPGPDYVCVVRTTSTGPTMASATSRKTAPPRPHRFSGVKARGIRLEAEPQKFR